MKILVPIKRVVDYNVKVRPKADESGVDLNNVKMAINPFCEIAVEEAVRLKEAGAATEIIAVTVGAENAQEQLRTALALGADKAILVETDLEVEPLGISKVLKAVVEKESRDSFSTTALSTFEIPRGSTSRSVSTKIALSAPKARAVLSCSWAFSAPTVTAMISVAAPASFSLTASSTAISQKGFIAIFTLLRSTPA